LEALLKHSIPVAALAFTFVSSALFAQGGTPGGPELIARAVAAFGGAAAVDAVRGLELRSRGTRRVQADDLPVTMLTRYFFPDLYYQELNLPMGTMKTVLGPRGAFIVAGEGSLPLPEGERKTFTQLVQRNVIAVLQARRRPDFRAEVVGTDTVERTAVQLVKVTRQGDTLTLAIDPATGEVRQTRFEGGGATPVGALVITFSDYQPVDTVLTLRYPMRAVGTMAGEPAFSQTVEAVLVNPKLDEALFEPPPGHAMFPGVEDLPLTPPPTLLPAPSPSAAPATPRPSPSPTSSPRE
jgi:hypothetical protein